MRTTLAQQIRQNFFGRATLHKNPFVIQIKPTLVRLDNARQQSLELTTACQRAYRTGTDFAIRVCLPARR